MVDQKQSPEVKLQHIAKANEEILYSVSTVFPFEIFPTTIVISKTKIDIINYYFFFSKQLKSIMLSELGRAEVTTTAFLSCLILRGKISDIVLGRIPNLPSTRAQEAQSIIQGLLVSKTENIDVQHVDPQELRQSAKAIGQPQESRAKKIM